MRGFGASPAEAFEQAALALTAAISEPSSCHERSPSGHVVKKKDDRDSLRSVPLTKMSSPEPRAVTMAGWRPHTDQVGQTGTKIAPDIYIACGISGATQHMAGCKGAKAILAVNTDPEAPILASADYAVIGDLHEVVPAISAELRKAGSG